MRQRKPINNIKEKHSSTVLSTHEAEDLTGMQE